MLIFRLVSGVTISVFEKSMLPSPGWGFGKPTPIPAAACTGTTEVFADAELAAPAGGIIANVVPDGIALSFVVPMAAVAAAWLPEGGVLASTATGGEIGFTLFVGKEGIHGGTIIG